MIRKGQARRVSDDDVRQQNQFIDLCLPKTLSGMTRSWAYGTEAADGSVSDSAVACYPVVVRAASAA